MHFIVLVLILFATNNINADTSTARNDGAESNPTTPEIVRVQMNHSTQIVCPIPETAITWTRENTSIPASYKIDTNMTVINAAKEDAGIYVCTAAASNDGKIHKMMFNLIVEYAPVVEAVEKRVGQALNSDASLVCKATAIPSPQIEWYFLEKKSQTWKSVNGTRYYNIQDNDSKEIKTSTLKVEIIDNSIYGSYSCRATNKYNTSEAIIELFQTDDPQGINNTNAGMTLFLNVQIGILFVVIVRLLR